MFGCRKQSNSQAALSRRGGAYRERERLPTDEASGNQRNECAELDRMLAAPKAAGNTKLVGLWAAYAAGQATTYACCGNLQGTRLHDDLPRKE
jgi:hypothetical protein